MKKFILLFIIIPGLVSANTLYVANFNNGTLTSLFGGTGSVYSPGTAPTYTFVTNSLAYGNNGYSLAFSYDISSSGLAQLALNILPSGGTNLTGYNYLSFRLMGSVANQFLQIQAVDGMGRYSYTVNVRNFISGGNISTSNYQKVIIPINTLNAYTQFNHFHLNSIRSINFVVVTNGAGAGLTATSGTIYLDEIVVGNGTGPVYIDNMEIPNGLSPYGYNLYNGGGTGGGGSEYYTAITKYTNFRYAGKFAYYMNHYTHQSNTWVYCQTVFQVSDYNYNAPTLIDASGCDSLYFTAARGSMLQGIENIYIITNNNVKTTPYNIGLGSSTPLNGAYQQFTLPLTTFGITSHGLIKFAQLNMANENNSGSRYNEIIIDEMKFVDTIPPQAPTNIGVNGLKLTNKFTFSSGNNSISATVFSNKPLDPSLEGVMVEYRQNVGVWKLIGIDYNTDKKDFTNVWNTMAIAGATNIDIRMSSFDSSANVTSSAIFNKCNIQNAGPNTFNVSLSNVDVANTLDFHTLSGNHIPTVASNSAGKYSFAYIQYSLQTATTWTLMIYTDNSNINASPRYKGSSANYGLYGVLNDGTGLIGNGNGAGASNSIPMRVWSDAKRSDGTFICAPCNNWKGTLSKLQGIPLPSYQGGATNLYWKNQDLTGNGTNNSVIQTNSGWGETANQGGTHPAYDANGDGSTLDSVNAGPHPLGKVYETSCWRPLTANVSGANKVIIINSTLNNTMSNTIKVCFAISDEQKGSYKTSQLIFELIIY